MVHAFITIRFLDVVDIFLVAFLLYQLYLLIRGTVAMRIFIGVFSIYMFWLIVKAMNMELLGSILGQVIGVGVIALLIVFQQEIRQFLLMLGNQNFLNKHLPFIRYFSKTTPVSKSHIEPIVKAVYHLAENFTGGLIVVSKDSELRTYVSSGEVINADISDRLINNIFYKNAPLHDGAIVIFRDKIKAAGCVLPVSQSVDLPKHMGLRHRAAVGMSERTDSVVIVVSEQTGEVCIAKKGKIYKITTKERLKLILIKEVGL
ncbi:MAG: diadenylate cyclase CdaA [Candidatus Delongbacteria bacterium]|jgi:diadenylate cyclase|nr:diadenylate cyclase CdaA [Candidatus Delongbacteria bacterium]